MIKINLLPKTINEKAILRNTAVAFGAALLAILVGGFIYSNLLQAQVVDMEQQATNAEAWKARVESIQTQARNTASSVDPMQKKLDFINSILAYNVKFPELFAQVSKWTYEKVSYTSMNSDGTKVDMTARVTNLDDLGRFLLNMYRATDVFTSVVITNVQGGGLASGSAAPAPAFTPPGGGSMAPLAGIGAITTSTDRAPSAQNWIEFSVTCTLKTPIAAPSFNGAGAGAGAPGGAPGGVPGGVPAPPSGTFGPPRA
jgi:hypothetical protein